MKSWTLLILSIIIVSGYIADVYLVLCGHIDTSDPNKLLMIGQAVGGMQAMAGMTCSYYFGTTKGSEDKNSAVSEAISKLPTSPATHTIMATSTTTNQEQTK